jgi:hypothetical protein
MTMPGERKLTSTVTIAVTVGLDGDHEYVVSDEDSEFARASTVELALPYVRDLLYGPGTLRGADHAR